MGSKKKDGRADQRIDEVRAAAERTVDVLDRRTRRAVRDTAAGVGTALVAGGAMALVAAAALVARRRRRTWSEAALDTMSRRAGSAGRAMVRRLRRGVPAVRFAQAAGAAAGTAAVARMTRRR
jgi:hypothetical protein